jgi:hypothetical protein
MIDLAFLLIRCVVKSLRCAGRFALLFIVLVLGAWY